jgi:ribosomal protein S24E
MQIIEQKDNKLLNREEVIIELTSETIPSKIDITKQIAEELKKPEENVVIGKINTNFGNQTFKVSAKVYDDSESKDKYETISRKQRKKEAEEAKKVEAEKKKAEEEAKKIAEAPKEETPTKIEEPKIEEATPNKEPTEQPKEETANPDKEPTEQPKEEKEE